MKTCSKCKVEQPKVEFSKQSEKKDGLRSHCKSCNKVYREHNKEREKENQKRWHEQNIEYRSQYKNLYIKQRFKTDHLFKLKHNLRTLIGNYLKNQGYSKSSKTEEILGASYEVVKAHLESTYLTNYSVPYQGQPVHIDHIIPCSSAQNEQELIKLQHYSNLQYLTPQDNLTKSDKCVYP